MKQKSTLDANPTSAMVSFFCEEKIIYFFSSDLSTRMHGTTAISISTDYFSPQKVNWDNLFNVCRPKKNKRHKGDMNGVQNILYA